MGTETKIDIDILQLYGIHLVKLNNPLMGTETSSFLSSFDSTFYSVKLNNPQMGTETDELFHNVSSVIKYS